jgi:hypothetical protein
MFYKCRKKEAIISLADRILDPFGGRLFAGFSLGKRHENGDG